MEHLSIVLTDYIFKKGIIDEKSYEIYQYGFQCFLEVSTSTICSIIIALLLHMLPECLFFFLLFIPMRSFSGGLHLKTYFSCFIGSCLILASTLLIVKYVTVPIIQIGKLTHRKTVFLSEEHILPYYSVFCLQLFSLLQEIQDICFFKQSYLLLYV